MGAITSSGVTAWTAITFLPAFLQDCINIRQVILAFFVLVGQFRQRKQQILGPHAVITGKDLADFALLIIAIHLLDNLNKISFCIADNPPISGRIIQNRRRHAGRRPVVVMGPQQRPQDFRADQRRITGKQQHVSTMPAQQRLAHPGGMAGAKLFGLLDEMNPPILAEPLDDFFLALSDDHQRPRHIGGKTCVQNPFQHRLSTNLMQRLGPLGLHPRRFSRGQDDGCQAHRNIRPGIEELPGLDSNQDKENQNLLCYRYTTG